MHILKLNKTHSAIISDDDVDLSELKWSYVQCGKVGYAFRKDRRDGKSISVYLHRVIAERIFGPIQGGIKVDHKNGDSLDNSRSNLRFATHKQNLINRGPNRPLEYKGVYRGKDGWHARIKDGRSVKVSGAFRYPWEAATQYDQWAKESFGEFAWFNYPNGRDPDQCFDECPESYSRKIRENLLRSARG